MLDSILSDDLQQLVAYNDLHYTMLDSIQVLVKGLTDSISINVILSTSQYFRIFI
jgi:hypothetical protein